MIRDLGSEVVEVAVDGQRAWALAKDAPVMSATEPRNIARLLPAFDPWVIGASRSSAVVIDAAQRPRVYRPQGWISPVVLVSGKIVGVWKHALKGRRLLVTIDAFGELPRWARTQVEAEAERLAVFFGYGLELQA